MSFLSLLNSCCGSYTGFNYNGTSIELPYYLGGKKTPDQIREAISQWIGTTSKTAEQIQEQVTQNPSTYGIDCSGLVYYALNEATSGTVRSYFENQLNLPGMLSYGYGISASNLTNLSYGSRIVEAKDIKPGSVIRMDNGGHVLVIHSVNKNSSGVVTSLVYAHSNGSHGPHHGLVTIGDQTKDLNHSSQTWRDVAYTDTKAKSLYNHTILLTPVQSFV